MNVLIPLVDGFEEIEATCTVDILRRAGIEVVTAGLPNTIITGARGMKTIADQKLSDVKIDSFDVLVLIGGPGHVNFAKSKVIMDAIRRFDDANKTIGAICAAPSILAKAGILDQKKATIFPGMERELPRPRSARVLQDGNIITSQGPGTAIEFALKLVEVISGKAAAEKVKSDIIC